MTGNDPKHANQWHAILQASQPGQPADAEARRRKSDFDPALWDPVHHLAMEYWRAVLGPRQQRVVEGLEALRELGHYPDFKGVASEAAALCFTATQWVFSRTLGDEELEKAFLQKLAAIVYYSDDCHRVVSPKAFWNFLTSRCRDYTREAKQVPKVNGLVTVVDHFLSRYGLGGGDNVDLVLGLNRTLSPLIAETRQFLEARAPATRERAPAAGPAPAPKPP